MLVDAHHVTWKRGNKQMKMHFYKKPGSNERSLIATTAVKRPCHLGPPINNHRVAHAGRIVGWVDDYDKWGLTEITPSLWTKRINSTGILRINLAVHTERYHSRRWWHFIAGKIRTRLLVVDDP